ncbi:MAG: phasin family protein [Herminiimonas sp.]|nr:phasin family protein [Herminiimonas sp.]
MSNSSVLNPIVDMYQTQLEASRRVADVMFSGTEKIDRMIIDATHHAFTEQLKFAQALAATRDPRGLASLQSSFLSRPENAMSYQTEIFQVLTQMQSEIGKSIQQYVGQISSKTVANTARPLEATAERAKEAAFNPMTGMFSVWESAFKEVAALANKNMVAARSSFENAANAAATAAANSAAGANIADADDTGENRKHASGKRR